MQNISYAGTVICIVDASIKASFFKVVEDFKASGKRVLCIIGASSRSQIKDEDKIASLSDEVLIATTDGSYGRKGSVVDILKDVFGVIEKSTHTIYPEVIYCCVQPDVKQEIIELAHSNKIKIITE